MWIIEQFWKTIESFFFDQTKSSEKITPAKGDNIFKRDAKCTKLFNASYLNLAKNMKVPEFNNVNSFAEEMSYPILKAVLKT